MENHAPIALFVYNRPHHTEETLKYLRRNTLAQQSELYVFSDGPKSDADVPKVEQVRKIIGNIGGFAKVTVIERPENFGLARSIIQGVSQLVAEYGKVIVFEDDLVSSPHTLTYFNAALSRYKDEERVMHIGSYMFPIKRDGLPQTFFFRAATSWGWATWERAWKHFEPNVDILMAQFDEEKKAAFSIDHTMNFWKQVEEFKSGKNNSWAIRWYASIFLREGLTLNPSQSLVQNIGHDGSGIHSGTNTIYEVPLNPDPVAVFPEEICENKAPYEALKTFFKNRKGSLPARIIRFARQKLAAYFSK